MSPNSALSQWPSDARRLEEPGVSAETATTRPKSPLEQPDKVTSLFRRIPTDSWVAPFPDTKPLFIANSPFLVVVLFSPNGTAELIFGRDGLCMAIEANP